MDFEVTYTDEQQRFRREVRAWLEANVPGDVKRTPLSAEDNHRRYMGAPGRRHSPCVVVTRADAG